jgi:nitroreductase
VILLKIPVDSWHDAIFLRHSQRKYSGEIPDNDETAGIERVCNAFNPFPGARAVLVREPANDVFKGAIGSYFFRVTEAPYYIAFIADMSAPNIQAITGYLGEGVILEATALGLNTCWVGGFFRREAVEKQIDLQDKEQVLAITPVGYSKDELNRVGVTSKTHKRKALSNLIVHGDREKYNWSNAALEAARLAPSAVNRQPWRFSIKDDSIVISSDNKKQEFGVSRRLDCGIAMLHLELGALSTGVSGTWEFLEHPYIAAYRTS